MTISGKQHRLRGFGNLRAIFGVAVLVAILFVCYKILPPYISNYQFQNELDSIARYSTYAQNKGIEDIKNDVIAKGKECDVLLVADNITIEKSQTVVSIDVKYAVEVQFPGGKTMVMNFNPSAGNKMITAK